MHGETVKFKVVNVYIKFCENRSNV